MTICCQPDGILETISDIANIIIACATLALGVYVFIYQRGKDKHDRHERILETQRNIRLEWFKEAIIHPNLEFIYKFYQELHSSTRILTSQITQDERIAVSEAVKKHCYEFRHVFIDLIGAVDKDIQSQTQKLIDNLLDGLTNNIFDEGINLTHIPTFTDRIEKSINKSKTEIFGTLFKYEGFV